MLSSALHLPSPNDLQASIYKSNLPLFIKSSWQTVEPTIPLSWNWHHEELCEVLQAIKLGQLKRVIINIPPGFSKSLITSVFFPSWWWAEDPSIRFLTASYTDDNTIRDNRRCRSLVTSDWFKQYFWQNTSLSSDQSGKIRFDTTAKGWRIATSVGGVATGEHPHCIIIDDALKAKDANSAVKIKECQEWLSGTISTRVALNPAIIVIGQRLHEMDPPGYLLAKDSSWEHVVFPMRYRSKGGYKCECHKNQPDKRDHRTVEGELLWPEIWPEEKVRQEELDLGPFGSAGQLAQDPVPVGGGLFKREWFDIVEAPPADAIAWCRGWDTAESDDAGDWTVGVKMSKTSSGVYYIEDATYQRSTLVDKLILNTARMDGKRCKIREGAGSGKAVIKARSILLDGYDYDKSPETDSKVERAAPLRSQCEAGNVKLVRGPWNERYLQVVESFPVGKFDDDVDATSNAYNELVGKVEEEVVYTVSWGGY